MSIEFYNISEGKLGDSVFSISDDAYNCIKVVLEKFQKSTGVYLDPYGTTRIYRGHIELLIDFLHSHKIKQVLSIEEMETVNRIITLFKNTSDDLIAEGE